MTRCAFRILWLLATAPFWALGIVSTKAQEDLQQPSVEIEGLNDEYPSCAIVQFSVRNISQRDVYWEAYAEEFKSNAWTYVDYTYDLRDPRSLYVKRVIINPDMTRTGANVGLKYDRCLKPTFVKEAKSAFIAAIEKRDREAASPVLQRVRIDVYVLDQGHIKRVQQVWSKTFTRAGRKQQSNPSSKHGNSSSPD
jgi:hypothetical protein